MGWTYTALTEKSEAKLIEITTDDGSLVFVNGTSSSSKTLSVIAEGFTPVSYKWEKKNGDNWTTISGATNSSYTITGVENVGTYRATAYEDANTGYYDIITIASVSDGQGGSSPYLFSLSNENFTINTTNDLKPTTSLKYEVKVTGYHGSSVMTSIASGTPTAEQFKIIIPSGSIFSLKPETTDTLVYAANTSTALSSENLAETITIAYDTNKSETKTITVSCAKNGISPTVTQGTGSVTIKDASGNTGTVNDGHSPVVTATKSGTTTTIKVDDVTQATINDGANGVSVSSVTEYYQRTNSATAPTKPASSSSLGSWKTTVDNPISTAQYLYNCEIIKFSNNLETVTNPVQIAKYVTNGANGKGISSIQNVYKLTTNTTAPSAPSATDAVWTGSATGSTSAWGTVCPTTTTTNKYLWNVERVTYDSNPATYSVSTVRLISTHGDTGATGGNGTDTWTPVLTSVTRSGNKFTKNLNSIGWNAQFYSKEGFKRCFISWKPSQTYGYIMVGLSADPSATSWESLDYAIYLQNNGTFDIRESGTTVTVSSNSYTTSNVFRVEYDGAYVNYYKDSTVIRSVARTEGTLLYADSTFFTYNAAIQDVSFGGLGAKGSNGTRGAYYRGPATSAPSSPVNGDYYFNTSTGYIQTYNGSSWVDDTMAVTNFHVLDAINDIISWCASNTSHSMYNTNKGLADSYVDKLLVGTALINKLFTKTITVQHDSSNTGIIQSSNYVANRTGFRITGEGIAEFNDNVSIGQFIFDTDNNINMMILNKGQKPPYLTKHIQGRNLLIGNAAGNRLTEADYNVFIGNIIGTKGSAGDGTTAVTASYNVGIGSLLLTGITTGNNNIAIGFDNLGGVTTGERNIALGNGAGDFLETASDTVYIGWQAGAFLVGEQNIGIGKNSLRGDRHAIGRNNIGIGIDSGYYITNGNNNIFIGKSAGKNITTGSDNIIIGNNISGASSTANLINIGDKIKHESGVLYSANSSGTFKEVLTEADIGSTGKKLLSVINKDTGTTTGTLLTTSSILTSKTAINTGALKSLLNVSEIYLRAMAVDSASGTTSQAYSKACSSYITFSNGLKIQWGVIKAGATRKIMYFPISFSGNNTYTLFLTNREPNNSGTDTGGWDYATTINSKTSSSANISIPSSSANFEWIAIGY